MIGGLLTTEMYFQLFTQLYGEQHGIIHQYFIDYMAIIRALDGDGRTLRETWN